MDKAKRKAIIAGNWKMNKTASEAAVLVDELIPAVKDATCEVVICTPFTDLVTAVAKTKGTNIHVGAENVHFEKSGAFTGEISADMLVDLGVEYVIVGHSERRQYFAETDQTVNKRTLAALNAGLKVIICVGESLQQREEGVTEELVRMQTKIALRDVTAEQMANVVIAYEPIWAIGTGKTATADQAEEVCGQIRKVIGELDASELIVRVVRNALTTVRNQQRVTIRVAPADEKAVSEALAAMIQTAPGGVGFLDVRADARLERGSCLLESELGVVDASLETQLKALENAFRAKIQAQG